MSEIQQQQDLSNQQQPEQTQQLQPQYNQEQPSQPQQLQQEFENQVEQQRSGSNNAYDEEGNDDANQNSYKEVLIKLSDLGPEEECAIISIANAAIEEIADLTNVFETQKFSKIAGVIKKELDNKFDSGWYVIVGKNFGSFVTHEKGSFMHFTFDDLNICVFRAR